MANKKGGRRWLKRTLIGLLVLIVLLAAGFLVYVSDYYRTDPQTASAIAADPTIRRSGRLTILSPGQSGQASAPGQSAQPNASGQTGSLGLVFYPGGKVEASAYVPLLKQIAQGGVTCVLVEMPFNLAVFDSKAAERAFAAVPEVKSWFVGGHSLGGAMASSYTAANPGKVKGLILLGAYIYGNVPASRALTLYGSEDQVLGRGAISYTENVVEIKGGNHAQFGNYGVQKGDGAASISREAQQAAAVESILAFMRRTG